MFLLAAAAALAALAAGMQPSGALYAMAKRSTRHHARKVGSSRFADVECTQGTAPTGPAANLLVLRVAAAAGTARRSRPSCANKR